MYAVVRRYSAEPSNLEEIRRRVDEEFLPIVSQTRGFVSYYALDDGSGDLVTVSVFLSKEGAEESTYQAKAWIQENSSLIPQAKDIVGGEVFSHGGQ